MSFRKALKNKSADILGLVEAGFPSPAEGASNSRSGVSSVDSISLDDYVISNREASFILKMKGDSMKDSGINNGDMIIVERGVTPKARDIVVVMIDGNFVMKDFSKIRADSEVVLEAVVVAVVRKYRK